MIQALFSDRFRLAKLLLALGGLVWLCLYSLVQGPRQGFYYEDCLDSPAACQGREILAVVRKVKAVGQDGFLLSGPKGGVPVKGVIEGLRPGQVVDVAGVFRPEGGLALKRHHVHKEGRSLKLFVSLVPLVVVGWLFYRAFGRPPWRG